MADDFIRFIGTGSAQVQKDRNHSSFVICSHGKYLLVDAGDGISKALLNLEIPFTEIHEIIISHMHPDHYSGLPALLIQMKLIKRTEVLTIHVHESLTAIINKLILTSYIFPQKLGFPLNIQPYTTDEFFDSITGPQILARQNSHLDSNIGISREALSFSCSSFLFKFNNKLVFYTGDIGAEEDLYIFNDFNIDLMISEVTHVEPLKIIEAFKSLGVVMLYFTHISVGDEEKLSPFATDSDNKIVIAKDGLRIPF